MAVAGWFMRNGPSGFGYNSTAEEVSEGIDLKGKTYLVTGCNSGLGSETARVLTLRGARVIAAARTVEKASEAAKSWSGGEVIPLACELSEPASVRAAVATVQGLGIALDGIIANAGIMALPNREVKHGLEMQFLTNHMGHFLLITGLTDQLTALGRVVLVSSMAHTNAPSEGIRLDDLAAEKGYSAWTHYGQAKLANLLFAKALARRFGTPGRTANALHPGVIATNLSRHMNPVADLAMRVATPFVLKTIPQGAATQVYVAIHPGAAHVSGEYWSDCNVAQASPRGRDDALADALYRKSVELSASLA